MFKGHSILSLSNQEMKPLRKDIQIIFQDPYSSLNPRMTVGSAIKEPMTVHKLYANDNERKEKVIELMEKTGLKISDFDLIEANEAFAVQCIVDGRGLEWDPNTVNISGGAIALGHPIGSSGSRIITTLIHNLKRNGKKRGLATLCLGGGGAVAMAIELV